MLNHAVWEDGGAYGGCNQGCTETAGQSVPPEVWTAILTLIAYQLGDALDKIVYKKRASKGVRTDRFKPSWLERARWNAQDALGITDGSYQTSLALVQQAHEALLSADVLNELAKFLRSLFLPACVAVVLLSIAAKWKLSLTLTALCVLILPGYFLLKLLHLRNLYEQTAKITKPPAYHFYDLGENRLFFWNGALVSSAPLPKNHAYKPQAVCRQSIPRVNLV